MIINELIQALLADDVVVAAVTQNVFPVRAPLSTPYPFVVCRQVGDDLADALDGPPGLTRAWVEVRVVGTTYTAVKNLGEYLAKPVKLSGPLAGFSGQLGGILVQGVHLLDQRDGEEPPRNADDVARYEVTLDFAIWYQKG